MRERRVDARGAGEAARCGRGEERCDRLIEIERWRENGVMWKHQEAENSSNWDDLYRYIGFLLGEGDFQDKIGVPSNDSE
uniref:Uncharacterized protein n=1 Tax=Oryza barthii TaxID=65489 RepID=A0A0D3F3B5_9ORYZ